MRLMHPILSAPIHWHNDVCPVLVIEHPRVFRDIVFELNAQADGAAGSFVLSLDYEPLDCADHIHVICDFATLPLDSRKLQNRFQSMLQMVLHEDLSEQTAALQQEIVRYLEQIACAIDFPISFSSDEYIQALLKALKCQPVLDATSPVEQLMQYCDLFNSLLPSQCFVLVCAHAYFDEHELTALYQMSCYKKWRLLLIEPRFYPPVPRESVCLIDSTFCELHLDSSVEIK